MVDTYQRKCLVCRRMSPGDARYCIHCSAAFQVAQTERLQAGATVLFQNAPDPVYSTAARDLVLTVAANVIRHWQNIAIIIGVVCLYIAVMRSQPIAPDPAWQAPVAPAVSNSYNDNSVNICFMQCR